MNVARNLYNKIPNQINDPCSYMKGNYKNSFFFNPTNEEEIQSIISNLNKSSPGFDGIDVKIIKHIQQGILTPLVHIFNLSFSEGKLPDDLKIAKVIPIYKKGDSSEFGNYHPVPILPTFFGE